MSALFPRRLRAGESYYLAPVIFDRDVVHCVALAASEARAARVISQHHPKARLLALPRACKAADARKLKSPLVVAETTPS